MFNAASVETQVYLMTRPLSYPLLILCLDIAKTVDYSSEYFGLEPLVFGSEILKSVHTHTHRDCELEGDVRPNQEQRGVGPN
jgi:hypothetical protein